MGAQRPKDLGQVGADSSASPQNDKAEDVVIYASGPNAMLKAVIKIAREHKIPAQVSMEAYMVCGIGVCRGCAIETDEGYKMCCQDGPVFTVSSRDLIAGSSAS